jgi:ATP-dependent Clp protease protease subunit
MNSIPSLKADIALAGTVSDDMLQDFVEQLAGCASKDGPLVLELTTTGGDADVARRIAQDIRIARELERRDLWFLGKSTVYSGGVTVMSAFPVERRFLTRDTVLLIHERRLQKELKLDGALRSGIAQVKDLLAELENGQALATDGFRDLIRGSAVSMDTLMAHVLEANWYVRADEALELRLIGGIV